VLLGLGACATTARPLHDDNPPGTWHVVKSGETPAKIAKEAGIPLEDLLEINGLRRSQLLEPGRLVFVLGASAQAGTIPPDATPATTALPNAPAAQSEPSSKAHSHLAVWQALGPRPRRHRHESNHRDAGAGRGRWRGYLRG
jgi:hypothetical protein